MNLNGSGTDITNNTASVGYKNPYRYRGYRYDTETGLYYLNARYYNADWGRFINADAFIGTPGELLSCNMFAYCNNSPINISDPSGRWGLLTSIAQAIETIVAVYVAAVVLVTIIKEAVKSVVDTVVNAWNTEKLIKKADSTPKNNKSDDEKTSSKSKSNVKKKIKEDKAPHIFRDKPDHVKEDTPDVRELLENVANDSKNKLGTDKYGNDWYAKTRHDGSQVWVRSRGGDITDGGINDNPIPWDNDTGLCSPTKPTQ